MKVSAPPPSQFPIRVIGAGNAHRGDDAVGLIIVRQLQEVLDGEAFIQELTGDSSTLLDLWIGAATVIIVDAMQSGAAPGTVYRIDASTQPIPTTYRGPSTHAFSVAEAIELGRALQQLPPQVIVYGVEGQDFTPGTELSPEVQKVVCEVVGQIWSEVKKRLEPL